MRLQQTNQTEPSYSYRDGTRATTNRSTWPDAVAYREAIQNPLAHLKHPELRHSEVITNRQGLPVAYTGRFAVVFRLKATDGSSWALRCFTSPPTTGPGIMDRGKRYQLITAHTQQLSDAFVPYQYLENGLQVGPNTYPAILMRWASGETLGRFVERNLHNPQALRDLCGALSALVAKLEAAGVSHGDWQHDNLLISHGGKSVTLVDYDGMFVPEFEGQMSEEVGHPNYQHPARTAAHFGVGLDRFPCLVIQTALLALSHQPSLWTKFTDGESLLFRKSDFVAPDRSPLLQNIRALAELSDDEELADSVARLYDACLHGPDSTLLPAIAPITYIRPVEEIHESSVPSSTVPPGNPNKWWQGSSTTVTEAVPPVAGSWYAGMGNTPRQRTTFSQASPTTTGLVYFDELNSLQVAQAEKQHVLGARVGASLAVAFAILCLFSLFSGGRSFPFYLFFWVFNLAGLGYNSWPRKKVYDKLSEQITMIERQLHGRREKINEERANLGLASYSGLGSVKDFVDDWMSKKDINLLFKDTNILSSAVKILRDAGITTALQLRRRTDVPGIPTHQMVALQDWCRQLEDDAAAEYRKMAAPYQTIPAKVARLEQEAAAFEMERDRLVQERDMFPDISLASYLARLTGRKP